MTSIPIINVNNKCVESLPSLHTLVAHHLLLVRSCSTGSSALWLARQAIEYGISDCVMALGFEKVRLASASGLLPSPSPS